MLNHRLLSQTASDERGEQHLPGPKEWSAYGVEVPLVLEEDGQEARPSLFAHTVPVTSLA